MSEATETTQSATSEPAADTRVVAMIQKYLGRNGGSASAILQPIGGAGVRITLVGGEGGILGDEVVANIDIAKATVAAVPGVTVSDEWTRELVSSANPKPGHNRQMAGWVATSTRFPG